MQVQELKAFLTVEGSLAESYQWRQLQPLQGSVLEGISRLPKQLLGRAHSSSADSCPKAPSATALLLSGPCPAGPIDVIGIVLRHHSPLMASLSGGIHHMYSQL